MSHFIRAEFGQNSGGGGACCPNSPQKPRKGFFGVFEFGQAAVSGAEFGREFGQNSGRRAMLGEDAP